MTLVLSLEWHFREEFACGKGRVTAPVAAGLCLQELQSKHSTRHCLTSNLSPVLGGGQEGIAISPGAQDFLFLGLPVTARDLCPLHSLGWRPSRSVFDKSTTLWW